MAKESLEQTIDYLLHHVETSKVTFIRNGTEHTPAEAVSHIKAKYDHFKEEIETPEDFIRLSASKSLLTGKPYLVRTPDGKEMHLDAWLTEALKAHRAQTPQSSLVDRVQHLEHLLPRFATGRSRSSSSGGSRRAVR